MSIALMALMLMLPIVATFVADTIVVEASATTKAGVNYRAHGSNRKWSAVRKNGKSAMAKKYVTALRIKKDTKLTGNIRYQTKVVKGAKWAKTKQNNAIIGSTKKNAKAISQMRVWLTGNLAKQYKVQYRVKQKGKWTAWKENKATAGSNKQAITEYQVRLVAKSAAKPTPTKVPESSRKDIKNYSVYMSSKYFSYSGEENRPAVEVYNNSNKKLSGSKDYAVKYSNNINAGTATVTIAGKGNYKGTIKRTFTISKATAALEATIPSKDIAVGGAKSKMTVTRQGTGKLTFTTDNAKVATVNQDGVITAVGAGITYISVRSEETNNHWSGYGTKEVYVAGGTGPKYTYKIFFLNNSKKYKDMGTTIYIKTNNPDPSTISITDDDGTEKSQAGTNYEDIQYKDRSGVFQAVEGGYVTSVSPSKVGSTAFGIKEYYPGWDFFSTYRYADSIQYLFGSMTNTRFSFTAHDRDIAYDNWVNDIIAKNTSKSKSFEENMNSVCLYIVMNYNYPVNNYGYVTNWRYLRLSSEEGALWDFKRLDSASSPSLLAEIARRLDPNCTVEFISGVNHASIYLTPKGGTKQMYEACPYMTTSNMDPAKIKMVDFSKFK